MKIAKILLIFVLLSVFFVGMAAAAEETMENSAQESAQEAEEKIIWKNPLPTLIQKLKHRAEETLDEIKKDFIDFPFCDFETVFLAELDSLIQELDEKIEQLYLHKDKNTKKDMAVLVKKRNLAIKLAEILYEYEKYSYFYRQGEEYLKKLEEFGWIIHYHDLPLFLNILSQFNYSRYRFQLDKELNINFDRLVIFNSDDIEFPNCLITGIIKYDNQVKNKLREDMIAFYFRGYLYNPMAMIDSEVFELRWFDSEGQKHIVWHPVMPYPFPIQIPVENSLY